VAERVDPELLNVLRNLTEVVKEIGAHIGLDDEYAWSLLNGVEREVQNLREREGLRPKPPSDS
jgi:hypothetical protein